MMNEDTIPTWELLQKKMTYHQLEFIQGKRILGFGSGNGVMASLLSKDNEVIAIEPYQNMFENMKYQNHFVQIVGGIEELKKFPADSFDVILCHNVLEYVQQREKIVKEFYRLLKEGGCLSIVKHNRLGRVMQMVVLLNQFEKAHQLLDGQNSIAQDFGEIHYYDDEDICHIEKGFVIKKCYGMRSFFDLQQKQDIQENVDWQNKMIEIEERVSSIPEFQAIAFFHHVIYTKQSK